MITSHLRVLGAAAIATLGLAAAVHTPAQAAEAPVRQAGGPTAVAESYIVVLRDGPAHPSVTAARLGARYGGATVRVYAAALRGFEVRLPERAARRLAADPAVAYVEQNHTVTLAAAGVQLNPPSWGLDRIDQRNLPLDLRYAYPNTAPNVHAYVIDTGIRRTHGDFGGRVGAGFDSVDGLPADDCNGHGTHLAGTIGGKLHGVAKEVRLVPVRVLDCAGSATFAQVIAGVDWVTANAVKPAVANLGVGGGPNTALDAAVTNSINSGISYAVPAGSSAGNACSFSPARVPAALTVAGTTQTDARMGSSNFGTCLDIFAPGQSITSTWHTSDTAAATISGSSMAAAHVTGCAALVVSAHPTWTAAQVAARLTATATVGVVTNPGTGSPNLLLYCVG